MQIHELNNFTGTLGSGAYLAIDDGTDTGKISSQGLLAATEARIDNIIAGPAPSAEEIVDARLGADGVNYPTLGGAIRTQVTDLKSAITELNHKAQYGEIEVAFSDWKMGGFHQGGLESSTKTAYAKLNALQGDIIKTTSADSAWYANIVTTTDNVNVADNLKGSYATFSAFGNNEFVVPRDCTVYVNVRNAAKAADATVISASDVNVTVVKKSTSLIQTNKADIEAIKSGLVTMTNPYDLPIKYGWFSSSGRMNYSLTSLTMEHPIRVKKGSTISCDASIEFQAIEINESTMAVYTYRTWGSTAYTVANDCLLSLSVRLANQSTLSDNSLLSKLTINLATDTPTYRNDKRTQLVNGIIPVNWYVGKHVDATGMNQATDYDTAIALWRELAVDYSGYITETDLGATYDSKHIYSYTLNPPHNTAPQVEWWKTRDIPTVIITTGMHGHEKSGTYGLYYLIKDMMEHSVEDPVLMFLRNNVRLVIMPAINVYGWNENSRYNSNGVNLNRNFGCYNWSDFDNDPTYTTPWQYNYRGTEPFSEIESQLVRQVVTSNCFDNKTLLMIDFHTYGINTSAYDEVAWATAPYKAWNNYSNKMNNIPVPFIAKLRSVFDEEYEVNAPLNAVYGEATQEQERPTAVTWAWESAGILSSTLECTSGADSFLGEKLTPYSADVIKLNAELIANYIVAILKEMA